MSQVHLRYDGQSRDFDQVDLDLGDLSSDHDVKTALATHLEVPVSKFANFSVDRNSETGDMTVRPQAVFG